MGIIASLLICFCAAALAPVVHRRGREWTGWALAALSLALWIFFARLVPHVAAGGSVTAEVPWLPLLDVQLSFLVDGLSLFFALLICGVGAAVFVYSAPYVRDHPHGGRYYAYMVAFMASMLGLVLSDNVFALYLFFELTSVASFLLIGLDHENERARHAAWQALIVTVAGGIALLAAVILLGSVLETFEISDMLNRGGAARSSALYTPIVLLTLGAAFTKSAQFPFYFWLPNAMEAPTPVSAYLHSATMVKAGIYLLLRFTPVLGQTDLWHIVVTAIGALTMLLASFLALRYVQLKRILAYSTVMALGLMTMLIGIGSEGAILACMAFILVHALYKAPLFMVAGTLAHATGTYDVTRLGGLKSVFPATFFAAVLAGLSMVGVVPLFGFVGKEAALRAVLGSEVVVLSAAAVAANAAVTAAAVVIVARPFVGPRTDPGKATHEVPVGLNAGPLVLAGAGLLFGVMPATLLGPVVQPAVGAVLQAPASEYLRLWHGFVPELGLSVLTLVIGSALYFYWDRLRATRAMHFLGTWLGDGLDRAYDGAVDAMLGVGRWLAGRLQTGFLHRYVAVTVGAGVLLIGFAVLRGFSVSWPPGGGDVRVHDVAVAGLIVVASVSVIVVRQHFTAVLALSGAGFSIAMLFLTFGAPDAAMVQLLVETLTLILVVLALIDMPDVYREPTPHPRRYGNLAIALGCGVVVTLLMLAVLQMPFDDALAEFYSERSLSEGHGRNVVNVILVDFRALDTLGEVVVLALAGLSAYALVHRHAAVRTDGEGGTSEPGVSGP